MNEQPQPPQMPYQPAPPQGPPTPPQQYGQPQQQLTPPQPMPGPQPPMPGQAPMQPMMQQPMPPYQMPPKGVNKGLLWGIIGGVVGLILIIVAIVVSLIMFSGPSENDYMEAQKVLDEAHPAYSDISDKIYALFSSSGKGTSNSSAVDSLKKSKQTLDEKFDKLSKMKAITGDKKVKEKWDKLNAKRDKFNKMIDFSIELSEKVLPTYFKVLQIDSYSTVSDINRMITDIENISISDTDTKQMMTEAASYLRAVRDYANAKSSSSYSYDSNAYDKYLDASDKFEAAHKKWTNSVDKRTDEAQIKNEVNDLIEELSHKGKDS